MSRILHALIACWLLTALSAGESVPGVDRLLFVKRFTYSANHYYTEFINSVWLPGGNICELDLASGAVREVVPGLKGGVFERFDLSFDAKRIAFAWKAGPQEGYRIWTVNVDGTGLKQITFPPADEAALVKNYRVAKDYHHGTDDMSPCWLPDGGIAFISTRCQYGVLCDSPDNFTTTVLHRMDADGANLRKLSNSALSEAAPTMLPDGRLMYTRWEYVDKGAVSVKCLWAMRPDGSGAAEIYGNDIALPPTLIWGRPIPGTTDRYVVCGTPHYPQNGVGTVIRLDMGKDMRSREPMTYLTPDVDIRSEGGFHFADGQDRWIKDPDGKGRLFKDPYPLADDVVLVAHKPAGPVWKDPVGYGLYLLDGAGKVKEVFRDPAISCWMPMPLKTRPVPPVLPSSTDEALARANRAACLVNDVYHGLEGIPRGTVKWLRIIEQAPRPWAARRRWPGDEYDQQHTTITKDTHLGLKVLHGVVPVEEDGSAHYTVPANANILVQALDQDFMAVQTERTFVNYMPGETRSCIGCHERPNTVVKVPRAPKAMRRGPSSPQPQPGESDGRRPIHYESDVQPVWNKHCLECHAGTRLDGGLDLSGTRTALFNVSYEQLVPERRKGKDNRDRGLLGLVIGENHPKTGNVHYLPPLSLGARTSVLMAMLMRGSMVLPDPTQAERVAKLVKAHDAVRLSREELVRVATWIDTNAQYYGSWWGKRNLRYQADADFRPVPSFADAVGTRPPAGIAAP